METRKTINGDFSSIAVSNSSPPQTLSSSSGYQLIETNDQRNQVNYDPSGSNLSVISSVDSGEFVVDTGIPIKSSPTSNSNQSKLDKKPLLYYKLISDDGSDSTKGSILSTGRHLLDKSAFSHRSIVNLYTEYKQADEKTVFHRFSFVSVIIASVLWISCWAGVIFLPLAMIIIGFLYHADCPSIPELPGLLILMGIVTTINNIVNVLDHIRNLYNIENDNQSIVNPNGSSSQSTSSSHLSTLSFILNLITTILIIYLSVIVFKYPTINSIDSNSSDFCSPVIYNFASWIIYLIGFLGLFIMMAIILGCCYILWKPAHCIT